MGITVITTYRNQWRFWPEKMEKSDLIDCQTHRKQSVVFAVFQLLTANSEGMEFKSGDGLLSVACLIMDRLRSFEFDGLKALIGLANAHVQVLLRPLLITGPAAGVGFRLSSSAEDETK